jgi:hypothetical protein
MNIDGDRDQFLIQADQGWPPSARRRCNRPLPHPVLPNQLFYDLRDCAALQSRAPRQIGARNRLARPNQLQHDVAIDAPRGFAGSQLNIGQVDMANAAHVRMGALMPGSHARLIV